MLVCALQATLSNCGNTLKTSTPSDRGKPRRGRANSPGYGNSLRYDTPSGVEMGNPQPSPTAPYGAPRMLFTGQMVVGDLCGGCLRYGRAPSEMPGVSLCPYKNRSVGEPAEGSLPGLGPPAGSRRSRDDGRSRVLSP